MPDELTPPQERAVRLALLTARYRTALLAAIGSLDQLAAAARQHANALRQALGDPTTDQEADHE